MSSALCLRILRCRRMKVIDARKVLANMRTVTRDNLSTPYSRCIDCDCKTRSHVLEPAEYEIYKGEAILGSSDVYASTGWEEVEEVDKYEMVIEPKVICHGCWLIRQDKFAKLVKSRYDNWMDNTVLHATEIKKAVNTQIAYDFGDNKTIHALKNLASQLKEAALDG